MRNRWWAPAGLAGIALIAAACGSSPSSSTASPAAAGSSSSAASSPAAGSSSTALKTAKIGSVTVLTNAQGRTLYWFVPDTSTKSNCNGSCATYWPPVKGPVTAGAGVTGTLGHDHPFGRLDAGHLQRAPLYTYIADTAAGQAKGNGLNVVRRGLA